jgi:hypothetical protein
MRRLTTQGAVGKSAGECLLLECSDRETQLLITISEAEWFYEYYGLTVEAGQITVARLRMLLTSFSVVGPNGEHVDESEYKTPHKDRPVESVAFKGILKQFSDGSGMFGKKTCWSVVETPEGEKLWISVAQTGVVVKQVQFPPLGPTILNIKGQEAAWRIGSQLGKGYRDEHVPEGMQNLELITFTLAALEAANTAEFISRVRKAIEEAGLEASGG